jgi:hypothetical protein
MRAQQLELIYSQSGLLYNFFRDAPWSILDKTKHKSGPHIEGIVGSSQMNPTEYMSNRLQQLLIQKTTANRTSSLDAPPNQTSDAHRV